jgi:hypothetical protein
MGARWECERHDRSTAIGTRRCSLAPYPQNEARALSGAIRDFPARASEPDRQGNAEDDRIVLEEKNERIGGRGMCRAAGLCPAPLVPVCTTTSRRPPDDRDNDGSAGSDRRGSFTAKHAPDLVVARLRAHPAWLR